MSYVSGIGEKLAKNIVDYRRENKEFPDRNSLKKVPRLGAKVFEQCAAFLRIPTSSNPLDNTAVHPERYALVELMAKDCGCKVTDLIADKKLRDSIVLERYVGNGVGMETLTDIIEELSKPGRDPRSMLVTFEFDKSIKSIDDVEEGMLLPGIVSNVTDFGCFVDLGIKTKGLIHVSQLADKFVKDPSTVVSVNQQLTVRVIGVDYERSRISLSLKGL